MNQPNSKVSPHTRTPSGVKAMSCSGQFHFLAANSTSRALMVSAAFRAAMPFRSAPDEAAVAEVLGTLSVTVEVIFTRPISTWKALATI